MLLKELSAAFQSCHAGVAVKKLRDTAKLPERGSEMAGGYDLFADIEEAVIIPAHQTVKIGTGLAMGVPEDTVGLIFARSGLATKQGLRPANCVGVCDADYTGEYIVAVHNDTDEPKEIQPGDKIAQLIVMPFYPIDFQEVDSLEQTDRGDGGFGSTDEQPQ